MLIKTILTIVQVVISVILVAIVMIQSGKESGLSGALTGSSDTYMSKSGSSLDKKLATATKWVALVWGLLTLALCLLP